MTSVTTILGYSTPPELCDWFKNNSKAKIDKIGGEARRIGTFVDEMIRKELGQDIPVKPLADTDEMASADHCLVGWDAFKQAHPTIVNTWTPFSGELVHGELIGHPDVIAKDQRGVGIIDIKTSRVLQPTYWVQTGAYAKLYHYVHQVKPTFLGILRLDKRNAGTYEYEEMTDPETINSMWVAFEAYELIYNLAATMRERSRQQREEQFNVS